MLVPRHLARLGAIALVLSLSSAVPAAALATTGLHVAVGDVAFNDDFDCAGFVCSSTADAAMTSNLGAGTIHWAMVTDFFEGWDSPCNHVDEVGTITVPGGSITEVSHHTDCRVNGIRIKTTFEIIGGTGAFAGATGGGIEIGGGNQFTYAGTLRTS